MHYNSIFSLPLKIFLPLFPLLPPSSFPRTFSSFQKMEMRKIFTHSSLGVKGHTLFSSHTCGRIIPSYLNRPTWWDKASVIKTPPFTFAPLRFDNNSSSPFMMVWCYGIPLIIHGSSSLRMGCRQYMPMAASPNSCIFFGTTLISKSTLPSIVALRSRTTMLAKFALPSRFLNN